MQHGFNLKNKNVLIIGYPGSGKTTIASKLCDGHTIIHTDDYLSGGEQVEQLIYDIQESKKPYMVEGVLGYKALIAGAEYGTFIPDVIVEVKRDFSKIERMYRSQRKDKSMYGVMNMIKGCDTLLSKYKTENPSMLKCIEWVTINNNDDF